MANPELDNIPVDASDSETLFTMHDGQGHVQATNALLAEARKIIEKFGEGDSSPVANTVLRGTGTGSSGFGQVATGDVADDSITQPVRAAGSTSGPTTASSTPAAIPQMTQTITVTGSGNSNVLVMMVGGFKSGTVNAPIQIGFKQDSGSVVGQFNFNAPSHATGTVVPVMSHHLFENVSAGSHTFTAFWASLDNTSTITAEAALRYFTVIELKK